MAKIKGFGALGNLYGIKQREKPLPEKKSQPQRNSSRPATAPYNFVGLPEKILLAPFELENFSEYISANGKISGEISLAIETLTPLFIGGCGTKSFAPVSTPIIPGSSLRGMFKNLCKIVTCGAFRGRTTSQKKGEDFNDEHIYFRCLMGVGRFPWTKDLNKLYNVRMVRPSRGRDGKTRLVKNARPGFLIRTTDNKFFIAPSICTSDRKGDRILIRDYEKNFRVCIPERNFSCVKWDGTTAYIITGSQRGDRLYDAKTYERLGGELTNWDTFNAQVRGHKLYWHKSAADWYANKSELALDTGKIPDKRLTKEMTPLETVSKFTAKIRFKNLCAVELGAIMMIFDLDDLRMAAYKIGQGKPFGFGSVKISPTLFVEDENAYTELFNVDGWQSSYRKKNPAEYLDEFKNYLAEKNLSAVWQAVMDERFKQRVPLLTIFEVVR